MSYVLLDPNVQFLLEGSQSNISVGEFWRWNGSCLLSNTLRGALAEFIIAKALEITLTSARIDWTAYDLDYPRNGRSYAIEVKASAYIQAWKQNKLSKISFDIAPSREWKDQKYTGDRKRRADVYVFCLHKFNDLTAKAKANPLDLSQWEFYVVDVDALNTLGLNQQSLSLGKLKRLSHIKCSYCDLKRNVDNICDNKPRFYCEA